MFLPGSWEPLFSFAASFIKCEAGGDLITKSNFLSLYTVIITGTGLPIKFFVLSLKALQIP